MPAKRPRHSAAKPKTSRKDELAQSAVTKKTTRASRESSVNTGSDYSDQTFARQAAILGDQRMSQPANAAQRASIVGQIQRDYGNQHVQRLMDHVAENGSPYLQTKLTVGPAGDQYEQEADKVAKEVVNSGEQAPAQRQEEEEEMMQPKRLQRQEEEEEMMQMKPIQRQEEEEEMMQMKRVQRQEEEEEELMMKRVQRQVSAEGGEVDDDVESTIGSASGKGQELPKDVRSNMESSFGADFSGVKVHTGKEADNLNDSMSARAFTTGSDIFFRSGDYNPGSKGGKELIAHELTHVVQQGAAGGLQRDQEEVSLKRKRRKN